MGAGDANTNSIVPDAATLNAQFIAKQKWGRCRLDIAKTVFLFVGRSRQPATYQRGRPEKGLVLADVGGPARALLTGERTALNFLGRIAWHTP